MERKLAELVLPPEFVPSRSERQNEGCDSSVCGSAALVQMYVALYEDPRVACRALEASARKWLGEMRSFAEHNGFHCTYEAAREFGRRGAVGGNLKVVDGHETLPDGRSGWRAKVVVFGHPYDGDGDGIRG